MGPKESNQTKTKPFYHHSASLVMPSDDPRYRFLCPTLTLMMGAYTPRLSSYPPDKTVYWKIIFFILHSKHNVVGTQKNCLKETVLLST